MRLKDLLVKYSIIYKNFVKIKANIIKEIILSVKKFKRERIIFKICEKDLEKISINAEELYCLQDFLISNEVTGYDYAFHQLSKLKIVKLTENPANLVVNLPNKLKILKLGGSFSENFVEIFKNLKYLRVLKFGSHNRFNEDVNTLKMKNLKILRFGWNFNKKLDNFLQRTKRLKKLKFGVKFNQKIKKLPKNLRVLEFVDDFNQELESILPDGLQVLHLSKKFNKKIDKLPSKLELLFLRKHQLKLFREIPKNIKVKILKNNVIYP